MPILSVLLFVAQVTSPPQAESARREQAMQWSVQADAAACLGLEGALTDPSSDIRIRAATALYAKCNRAQTGGRAAGQLCRSADLGTSSAAVYLLLGYASRAEAEPCLRKPRPNWNMVKLATSTRPVAAALAARVGLARLGDPAAVAELRSAFGKNTVDEALFLLAALPDIEDREALEGAIRLLDDARETPGVKSGSKRQVRDAAADALVQRFQIKPGYPLAANGKRYSESEISAVREPARGILNRK